MVSLKILVVLWIIHIVLLEISVVVCYIGSKIKAEAIERQAMSIYQLYKQIKRLNDRIECKACAGNQK